MGEDLTRRDYKIVKLVQTANIYIYILDVCLIKSA